MLDLLAALGVISAIAVEVVISIEVSGIAVLLKPLINQW